MTVKLGVLSGESMPMWKLRDLEKAVQETDTEITLAIIDDRDARGTKDHAMEALKGGLWNKYNKLSWKLNSPILRESESIKNHLLFTDAKFHYCEPAPADDIGITFPSETVELAAAECDLLFRSGGFGIIKGDILTATKYGVLSYHSADIRKYRGKPPGFWEYMNDDTTGGITLQRLNETLDGGEIVVFKEIDISGLRTWRKVRHELNSASIGMMATAIERLTDQSFEPLEVDELGDLYTNPTNLQMMKFLPKNSYGYIRSKFD